MLYSLLMNPPYFRPGAGSVIFNQHGKVLVFERADLPHTWQFQQGGLDGNETPQEALWRELREETGLLESDFLSCTAYPDWTLYTYNEETRAKFSTNCLGQVHRWFFLHLRDDVVIDLTRATDNEFTAWKWLDFSTVLTNTNAMKLPVYQKLFDFFADEILPRLPRQL